jgi:hypothetical protein
MAESQSSERHDRWGAAPQSAAVELVRPWRVPEGKSKNTRSGQFCYQA